MYERLEECPVCKHPVYKNHMICKDHLVSEESFALVKCQKCELLYTNPRPESDNIGKYYQSENYISHTGKGNNLTNILYKTARYFTIRNKFRLISGYQKKAKILDYGCGTGDLLKHFAKKGWETTGIEPDEQARKKAQEKNQLTVHNKLADLHKDDKFDVIMLWHVMEHISELSKTIKKIVKHLTDKGTIIIAVPNHLSYDAEHYKENWAAYDVPRHLYHFNQLNIKELFNKMKVKLKKTHPMKLDAYYVALLSEKNSTGKTNYLKAFRVGYKSNKLASKNDHNYSSLIYVVQK